LGLIRPESQQAGTWEGECVGQRMVAVGLCGAATHATEESLGLWAQSGGGEKVRRTGLPVVQARPEPRQSGDWVGRQRRTLIVLRSRQKEPRRRDRRPLPTSVGRVWGTFLSRPDRHTTLHPIASGTDAHIPNAKQRYSPEGRRLKAYLTFSPLSLLTTMVWPALLPPAQRAQTSASAARMSTSLPLPSSPHWEPRLAVSGVQVALGHLPLGVGGGR
jgi:hypothetical protein